MDIMLPTAPTSPVGVHCRLKLVLQGLNLIAHTLLIPVIAECSKLPWYLSVDFSVSRQRIVQRVLDVPLWPYCYQCLHFVLAPVGSSRSRTRRGSFLRQCRRWRHWHGGGSKGGKIWQLNDKKTRNKCRRRRETRRGNARREKQDGVLWKVTYVPTHPSTHVKTWHAACKHSDLRRRARESVLRNCRS